MKQAMFKMCLINKGVLALEQADLLHELRNGLRYEQISPDRLGSTFTAKKAWLGLLTECPDNVSLMNSKAKKQKCRGISFHRPPHTINLHFDKLEELLLETKLMDSQSRGFFAEDAGPCIWTVDEKGLSGWCDFSLLAP